METVNKNYDITVPRNLEVTIYGDLEPFSDSISKCRVRIFYKGMNRNRTYISEDFAQQLINSLPYTPVKGIFDGDDVDFTSHGEKNSEGRIYGIVMADPNFAWEEHEDSDGVVRNYACADVLLYTGLYKEANLIKGSSQSMEINPYTFQGEWKKDREGMPYFYFTKGSLFGLQVLGMATEPCFEGAAFYYDLVQNDLQELITYVKKINKEVKQKQMDEKVCFRLSDQEKASLIDCYLNPEGEFNYCIDAVYDDYAICFDVKERHYVRVYYTKNDADDTVTLGEIVPVKIVDVTESEYAALQAVKAMNGGSYKKIDEKINGYETEITSLNSQIESNIAKNNENENTIATLNSELEALKAEKAELEFRNNEITAAIEEVKAEKIEINSSLESITSERDELLTYKKSIETEKKEEILSKYSEHLTDSVIEDLKAKIDSYSVEDFKKEVCTAAVECDPAIFENKSGSHIYQNHPSQPDTKGMSNMERMLFNHKYGGNK